MYIIHRLAGKSDEVGYSDLYSDISDRYESALYNTITSEKEPEPEPEIIHSIVLVSAYRRWTL
jgi:hypothetical protein